MADASGKILLIEDDKFLSSVLKSRMEREGFTVLQAFDGNEGFEIMKDEQPDLVVLDLIMPNMSGFDLLEKVSTDPQMGDTPIVVASNLGQESDIEKAKRLGVRDYFVKVQMSIDELAETLKDLAKQHTQS